MFGPKNRAADVAVLLEEGLRNDTIVVWYPEDPNKRLHKLATKGESWTRFLRFGGEAALANAFAFGFIRLYDNVSNRRLIVGFIIAVILLVGYRYLANALSDLVGRRPPTVGKPPTRIGR